MFVVCCWCYRFGDLFGDLVCFLVFVVICLVILVFWLNCLGVCLMFGRDIVVYLCLFYCYSCLGECVLSFVLFTLCFFTYLV